MLLSELITSLESAVELYGPDQCMKLGISNPHSWRGDYRQVAFNPTQDVSLGDMLKEARSAIGTTYTGYKGGRYTMNLWSKVYLAVEGQVGEELGPTLLRYMLSHPADRYEKETENP